MDRSSFGDFNLVNNNAKRSSRTRESTNMRSMPSTSSRPPIIPHRGGLCRFEDSNTLDNTYVIQILVGSSQTTQEDLHELVYSRRDFEFVQRLFAILDTENRGTVDRSTVQEFVTLRCPVFRRRDDDLRRLRLSSSGGSGSGSSATPTTFDEIWTSVASSSRTTAPHTTAALTTGYGPSSYYANVREIGVEGWMVFCRFIALAQYLEAKRRFSARHLQQTMRHRNSPRGSEVVFVDVPPPEPPTPLSPEQLAQYERKSQSALPVPELDLDHSLLAAHDFYRKHSDGRIQPGSVKISLFGPTSSPSFSSSLLPTAASMTSSKLEFAVTYTNTRGPSRNEADEIVVRRSMEDLKWLNEAFVSHKVLGGTLCGRILPPFPNSSSANRILSSHFHHADESVIQSSIKSTSGAINAAAASVSRFSEAARSFLGSYLATGLSTIKTSSSSSSLSDDATVSSESTCTSASSQKKTIQKKKKTYISRCGPLPESYYNPNSALGKARQLERYLNYLLEHPALSTSFALNTILKASQSGLDAARQCLEECSRTSSELKSRTPQLDDGKLSIPFWPSGGGMGEGIASVLASSSTSSSLPHFAWVRTAAQAAIALQVHGFLENSGMNSASARLQHASLPSFGNSARNSSWEDEEQVQREEEQKGQTPGLSARFCDHQKVVAESVEANNFEEGVINVSAEILRGDDDYDLLPLPFPAPERRILSAGSDLNQPVPVMRETRFHYGTAPSSTLGRYNTLENDEESSDTAFLGDIAVDENIDKLREVIGSVDNTLSRCLASSGGIGKAQKERQDLHLGIVRGLDSWAGMRGKFITQRSLMKGVDGVEQSKEIYEEGNLAMIDDLSWQTALANSAVMAAEDVRSAVRASRTAASAKSAAISAAFSAQNICSTSKFASIDEARAAQTRASIAQSHAVYATVVDHEARTVKRRAALALANDVKCWNVHRKREILQSCISYARSQHEATRRAVDAWSSLRDGYIGTTVIQQEKRPTRSSSSLSIGMERHRAIIEPEEVTATIYGMSDNGTNSTSLNNNGQPLIVAVDHNVLGAASQVPVQQSSPGDGPRTVEILEPGSILPFATAAPIAEEGEEDEEGEGEIVGNNSSEQKESQNASVERETEEQQSQQVAGKSNVIVVKEHGERGSVELSESMQSLVNGLMSWGGGIETEEAHFALPAGMAASIALEESGVL